MHIWPAKTKEDLMKIESLSWEIIHEHYDPYIDPEHVEFYLETYQTVKALEQQMKLNYFHYLIMINRSFVGFVTIQELENTLRLSKLYIHESARNHGIGENVMDFVEDEAEERGKKEVDLIVNRKNEKGIRFYKRLKYEIVEELLHHFDNGHSEEDYRMSKKLPTNH